MNNDDKILTYKILGVHVHLSKCWRGTDLVCWSAEGIHAHLLECWRGTW